MAKRGGAYGLCIGISIFTVFYAYIMAEYFYYIMAEYFSSSKVTAMIFHLLTNIFPSITYTTPTAGTEKSLFSHYFNSAQHTRSHSRSDYPARRTRTRNKRRSDYPETSAVPVRCCAP